GSSRLHRFVGAALFFLAGLPLGVPGFGRRLLRRAAVALLLGLTGTLLGRFLAVTGLAFALLCLPLAALRGIPLFFSLPAPSPLAPGAFLRLLLPGSFLAVGRLRQPIVLPWRGLVRSRLLLALLGRTGPRLLLCARFLRLAATLRLAAALRVLLLA